MKISGLDPVEIMRTCGFILVTNSTLLLLLNLIHPIAYLVAGIAVAVSVSFIPKVSDKAYILAALHLTAGIYYSALAVVCLSWLEVILCAAFCAYLELQEKNRIKKRVRHLIG